MARESTLTRPSRARVGTYAGQVIMEGFLRRRVPLTVRRLATMAPAFALIAAGADPVRLLGVSQVALSVGLPSVLIPLVGLNGVLLYLAVTA